MTYETLHLCNANDIANITLEIETYKNLISKNDAVIFYAENLNEKQYKNLFKIMTSHRVYFIIDNNINNLKTINYDEWLNLVNLYKKTFTWK